MSRITADPTVVQPGSASGDPATSSNVSSTTFPLFASYTTFAASDASASPDPTGLVTVTVGAAVGAAIGALVIGSLITLGVWAVCRRRRRRREEDAAWPAVEEGLVAGAPYRTTTIDGDDSDKMRQAAVLAVSPYALSTRDDDDIEPAPRAASPEMASVPRRAHTFRSPPSSRMDDSTGSLVQRSSHGTVTAAVGSRATAQHPSLSLRTAAGGAEQWYGGDKADAGEPTPLSPSAPDSGFFAMGRSDGRRSEVKPDPPADTIRSSGTARRGSAPSDAPRASGSGAARPPGRRAQELTSPLSAIASTRSVPEDAPPEYVRDS